MRKTSKIILVTVLAVFCTVAVANAAAVKKTSATTTAQAIVATKLTEVKLKVCQNKEAAIQKRNTALNKMAANMLTKFDSIATRVETYYTTKAVPAGKTVTNYDALVAEIATKKTAVTVALTTANTDAAAFSCASDDPKGQLTLYRTDMQAVKQALKDYRTSIKNLIVAVRTANSTTNP